MGTAVMSELQIEGDIAAVVGAGFGDGNQVVESVEAQQEVPCAASPGASETGAGLAVLCLSRFSDYGNHGTERQRDRRTEQ